jgi:hypothetical protein
MPESCNTFLFDNINGENAPFTKAAGSSHKSILYTDLLKHNNTYKIKNIIDYNSFEPSIYVVELIWGHINTLFENLDREILFFLVKYRIPILFYFPSEGFCIQEEGWTEVIETQLKKHNLEKNLKYFITGNLRNKQSNIFNKTYSVNYFEHVFYRANLGFNIGDPFENFKYDRDCTFLSYNSRARPGRTALASEIVRKKLHKNALFSWMEPLQVKNSRDSDLLKFLSLEGHEYYKNIIKNGFDPYILDINNDEKTTVINSVNWDHYRNSYFSLVSETETSKECLFITEKIFKPIYAGHPFIIWSSPRVLDYLKSIGYKTFPSLFDESYDDELDPKKRLKMIIQEVTKFKQLNKSKKKILFEYQKKTIQHNYKNLCIRWKTAFINDLEKILLDIMNDIEEKNINETINDT